MVDADANTPLVIIKPKAYLKMLKHVLRFGSIAKKKSQMKECMGMLFGKLGAQKGTVKDVEVVDVVEVTHGGHIEVSFEDKDYVAFAEINEKYAAQGVFNVGWYHSHPGLSVFLSTVDVRNHLGFQTTNPSAIAIVWDHVLLEESNHIGFDTFRLTELGKGQYSDYKAVKTVVEPPNSLDIYKLAIKDTLDMQLAGNPPMLEINELPNVVGDFEPTAVDDAKFTPPSFPAILSQSGTAKVGNSQLSSAVMNPISNYLNNWVKDLGQSLKNKNVVINQNMSALKDSMEKHVKNLQVWFMEKANDIFLDIWQKVDTEIENQIQKHNTSIEDIVNAFSVPPEKQDALKGEFKILLNEAMAAKQLLDYKLATLKGKK